MPPASPWPGGFAGCWKPILDPFSLAARLVFQPGFFVGNLPAMGKKKHKTAWGEVRDAILPDRLPAYDGRFEPNHLAHTLTADRIHGILRSAESGNTADLFTVYRDMILGDSHIQSEFTKRKLAVLGLPMAILPADSAKPEDEAAADLVRLAWEAMPGKIDALSHLLDACLWPVSLLEKVYRPSNIPGLRFEWGQCGGGPALQPVLYHLLDYTQGRMRIQDIDPVSKSPVGTYREATGRNFVIHRGSLLQSFPDNFGGPMRAALFWWLFKTMDRGWWIRFLERFGAPFTVAKYDDGRDDTKYELERALSAATRLFGLVVTRGTDVELLQANASQSGDAFEKFKETADRELSKLIIGQTSSSEARSGGLNNGQADLHSDVRDDYRDWDAGKLRETVQEQLIVPFLQLNAIPGRVRFQLGREDTQSLSDTLKTLEALPKAGLEIQDTSLPTLSRVLGYEVGRIATPAAPTATPFSADFEQATRQAMAAILPKGSRNPADWENRFRRRLVELNPADSVRHLETLLQEAVLA
jgi:hypothetical protein